MIRVTVWNEYKHERESEEIAKIYPNGIHGCIKDFLLEEPDFVIRTATFEDALNIARAAHSRDFSHELAADRSILN